ncbi:unnamed protein product [Tuber aestivum]|uniref:Uncharacterized protein n=1 Tax=Tuber aestivum TaxID=59557 RepID=A0A292PSL2_9PEZI|nr:unnamed protein product [Tuber aestivum]
MSGPYFHSESWVGKFAPDPIKPAQGASASISGDTKVSTARESRTPVVAPSQASPQAPPPSSSPVTSPTYSPDSGPGGTPTPPGTPPTPAPVSSPGHNPGGPPPPPVCNGGGSSPGGPPPDARPPASHPEPPPAPIEYNDPTLACIQTVQHCTDRLPGDREIIKTIEALSSNIAKLEKRCEEIIERIRSRDHNDYARVTNGGVKDHTTSLVPLYDLENSIPASFPKVVGDIRRLNTTGLNTLLSLYGIPIDGTIAMKKKKLALFVGLTFDIDV